MNSLAVIRRAVARDPQESHRAATVLELFFDLVFVVAFSTAGGQLHHALAEGHFSSAVGFVVAFLPIWWAWMNFTWFASAFDNDDLFHRFMTLVIMAGALVFAAGIPEFMEAGNALIGVLGYVIMRVGMIALWLRTASHNPQWRATALWYAGGLAFVQILWVARLWAPTQWLLPSFAFCFALELLVPVIAESHRRTPYHLHHIVERYGLLIIILLGEGLVGVMASVQSALAVGVSTGFVAAMIGGLLLVFVAWWWYFEVDQVNLLARDRVRYLFGYGHAVVFLALAAFGPLLEVAVDILQGDPHASTRQLLLGLTATAAIYFVLTAVMSSFSSGSNSSLVIAICGAGLMIVVAFFASNVGFGVLWIGIVTCLQLTVQILFGRRKIAEV